MFNNKISILIKINYYYLNFNILKKKIFNNIFKIYKNLFI